MHWLSEQFFWSYMIFKSFLGVCAFRNPHEVDSEWATEGICQADLISLARSILFPNRSCIKANKWYSIRMKNYQVFRYNHRFLRWTSNRFLLLVSGSVRLNTRRGSCRSFSYSKFYKARECLHEILEERTRSTPRSRWRYIESTWSESSLRWRYWLWFAWVLF